ncbi:MAG TPA: 50S ribosomal protein L23 [archaeon]|nr:50S ribosomal protein L23 [archaeon]
MDPYKILQYPYMTEKSVNLVEKENKVVFIVDREANKTQIREAVETMFEVKVDQVNTMIDMEGRKKAFIKLKPEFRALDVATKLGLV